MNAPEQKSLIHIFAGILVFSVGLAVFVVRLHHDGPYVMPLGGAFFGAVGALLLGGILIWQRRPRVIGWIALAVSPVALSPAIYSVVAELEEVVSLYAVDAEGRKTDLRLWIVDREDGQWVGMSRDKAIEYDLNGAHLEMLRAGRMQCVIPVLHDDHPTAVVIHAMKVEKYAAARAAAMIGMYPRQARETTAALRLDPCP